MSMQAARRAFSRDPTLQATGRLRESGSAANLLCIASLRSTTRMTTTGLTLRCQETSDDGYNVLSWNQSGELNSNDGSLAEHTHTLLSAIYHDSRNGSSPHLPRIVHATQNDRSEGNPDRRYKTSKGSGFTSGEVRLFLGQTFKPTSWTVRVEITVFGSEKISISTRGYFLNLLLVWHMSFLSFPELREKNTYLAGSPCAAGILNICRLFTRDRAIVRYGMCEDPDRLNQGCCTQYLFNLCSHISSYR